MKKYLRLDEILSKTFIYSFIFLKMKILLAKPGELPEISIRPTGLTLALASGRALISNPAYLSCCCSKRPSVQHYARDWSQVLLL